MLSSDYPINLHQRQQTQHLHLQGSQPTESILSPHPPDVGICWTSSPKDIHHIPRKLLVCSLPSGKRSAGLLTPFWQVFCWSAHSLLASVLLVCSLPSGKCSAGLLTPFWQVFCWSAHSLLASVLLVCSLPSGKCSAGLLTPFWQVFCWSAHSLLASVLLVCSLPSGKRSVGDQKYRWSNLLAGDLKKIDLGNNWRSKALSRNE